MKMTKEEILAMRPGEDLNIKVAEHVMGNTVINDATFGFMERFIADGDSVWGLPESYSEDMSAAELVLARVVDLGYGDAICLDDFADGKCTEAEAICKAALLAMLERERIPPQERRRIEEVSGGIIDKALGEPPYIDDDPGRACCP